MKDPEDLNDKIMKMWTEDMTSSEIASQIGMTRGAVMGKVYRLIRRGLLFKKTAGKGNITLKQPGVENKPAPKQVKKLRRISPKYLAVKYDQPPKDGLTILELTENSCRYIIGNQPPEKSVYCGKKKKVGSYCEDHARLCYIPATIKPRDKVKNTDYRLR